MNEMQSELATLTTWVNEAEEPISDPEDKLRERKEVDKDRNRQLVAYENRLREINNTMRRSSVRIIGIPEAVLERED